jgi:hypothetical protein
MIKLPAWTGSSGVAVAPALRLDVFVTDLLRLPAASDTGVNIACQASVMAISQTSARRGLERDRRFTFCLNVLKLEFGNRPE